MPYKSEAQERYFNANRAELEAKGVDVDEWNKASKREKLPNKLKTEGHEYDHKRPSRPVRSRYNG